MAAVALFRRNFARWLPVLVAVFLAASAAAAPLEITPAQVTLDSPESTQQLLISEKAEGRSVDLTRQVKYRSDDTTVATVDELGLVQPVRDGKTTVVVEHGGNRCACRSRSWASIIRGPSRSRATLSRF